jgi:hypothetical protein
MLRQWRSLTQIEDKDPHLRHRRRPLESIKEVMIKEETIVVMDQEGEIK